MEDTYKVNQIVVTPHGKAKITAVDVIGKAVRVEHIEARIPITDYRFSELTKKTPVNRNSGKSTKTKEMKQLLTILFLLWGISVFSQSYVVPEGTKYSVNLKYQYTKTKAVGDGLLVLASFTDGFLEGYGFTGRKTFERWGADPYSFGGSKSYLTAYKNNDPAQGFKSDFHKSVGAFDFYHLADDLRKLSYISAGITIGIGGYQTNNNWKHWAIDIGKTLVVSMVAKRAGMSLARGENFFKL